MRDPDGTLEFSDTSVIRHISPSARALAFLNDAVSRDFAARKLIVPFEFTGPCRIESPRYHFVSYPFEWCDAQLHKAAMHTLAVAREALEAGYELKDASAWNIIFDGVDPVFCDHLSFEKVSGKEWWAFGQFARHFIFPLAISRQRSLNCCESFAIYRDGVPVHKARSMLGISRFVDRSFPLYFGSGRKDIPSMKQAGTDHGKTYHKSILDLCEWMIGKDSTGPRSNSAWFNYTGERAHYTEQESQSKRDLVYKWLQQTGPEWVMDLGCNTGEFSRLALDAGARVIAADIDHDCIQNIFHAFGKDARIHPVVLNLGDMHGGKGFSGEEFPSFLKRTESRVDMVMMLALIHHLTISEGISMSKVAEFAGRITRRHLILELVDASDPLAQLLARQRNRDVSHLGTDNQLSELTRHFDLIEMHTVNATGRKLALMQKKTA